MLQKFFLPELRYNASVENSYFLKPIVIFLGDVQTKLQKFDLLPPCSENVRFGSALRPCPCGYTINFKKSKSFHTKMCGRPHLSFPLSPLFSPPSHNSPPPPPPPPPPPLTADVFYGWLLSKDVIFTLVFVSLVQHSLSFGPRAATEISYLILTSTLILTYKTSAQL